MKLTALLTTCSFFLDFVDFLIFIYLKKNYTMYKVQNRRLCKQVTHLGQNHIDLKRPGCYRPLLKAGINGFCF